METIRTIYQGDLRTQSTHVASGYQVMTDVPKEHGGKGESFSPTDLFCASLVSSMLSGMGGVMRNPAFRNTIDGIAIVSIKIMKQNPQRLSELVVEFSMPNNNFTAEQKKMLEEAVANSLVGKCLNADFKQTLIFKY